MIRVLLAEDQAMVRGALAALLELEGDFTVAAQAGDGAAALEAARAAQPDLVLADIEMPKMTGLELAAALRAEGNPARVVILTTFARPGYLRRALEAGVAGYLLKDAPATELAAALRRVHAGLRAIDPELAAEGKAGAEIAQVLHLSEGTVRNYLSEAITKLGARNRVEAARLARAKGWL